jgi:hypothetical protein
MYRITIEKLVIESDEKPRISADTVDALARGFELGSDLRSGPPELAKHLGEAMSTLASVMPYDVPPPGPDAEGPPPDSEDLKFIHRGRIAWTHMIADWRQNFGVQDTEQPPRIELMQTAMANDGHAIFAFIAECGGLRGAVRMVLPPPEGMSDGAYLAYADDIAGNIVAISSIYIPELADTMEYTAADRRG